MPLLHHCHTVYCCWPRVLEPLQCKTYRTDSPYVSFKETRVFIRQASKPLESPWLIGLLASFLSLFGCSSSEPLDSKTQDVARAASQDSPTAVSSLRDLLAEDQAPPADEPQPGQPWFIDETEVAGINFRHMAGRSDERLLPEIMGSGVLIADFNRDGSPDMLFINGGQLRADMRPVDAGNRLYLGDGHGHFRDATEQWKLPSSAYGMGGTVGDFNNDGWVDVYLTTYGGGDMLLRNTGMQFEDVTVAAGIPASSKWSSSALFFDADGDGWLDLLVVRYVDYDLESVIPTYSNGVHVYSTPQFHDGVMDQLYRNNRDGTFSEVVNFHPIGAPAEIRENPYKGLAVGSADLTGDGLPDLYIANDMRRNFLLVNDGNFVFREAGQALGAAFGDMGTAQAGMGVAFSHFVAADVPSIACSNFEGEPTNLFVPLHGRFMERSLGLGVARATRPRLQWGLVFFDANNDGQEELLIASGHIYDNIQAMSTTTSFAQQNTLLRYVDGQFRDISNQSGPALRELQVSRGVVVADFDGDGRLDFVVSNNDGIPQFGRNITVAPGHFVSLWLEGTDSNRSAIGAKIDYQVGDKSSRREIFGGTSYLSANDLRVHLGLGDANAIDKLSITWPSGHRQTFTDVTANQFYHLIEGRELVSYRPGAEIIPPEYWSPKTQSSPADSKNQTPPAPVPQ